MALIRRSILPASIASLLQLVVAGTASPAAADPPPVAQLMSQWSSTVVHPGETVSLTTTFTNLKPEDVVFVFLTINSGYDMITDRTRYSYLSCTGDAGPGNECPTHPNVPIAPGATRTMVTTWRIDDDSPCGESVNLGFFYYLYFETASTTNQGLGAPPPVTVLC